MAMTQDRPATAGSDAAATSAATVAPTPVGGLAGVLGSGDHRVIGRLFVCASLLFLVVAGVAGGLFGGERLQVGTLDVFDDEGTALQVLSLHSVSAVFLFLLPLVLGIAFVVVPAQLGSRTIAFPRAAAASFWLWLLAGGVLLASYAIDGGPFGDDYDGVGLFVLSLAAVVAALLLACVCVVTTVLGLRADGMHLERVPFFSWSMLVAGSVWLLTLPVLVGQLVLAYLDHRYGQGNDGVLLGGSGGIYPRTEWAFQQPQVWAYAVPALGVVAECVPVLARTAQRFRGVVLALIGMAGVLGIGAWTLVRVDHADLVDDVLYIVLAFAVLLPLLGLVGGWADTVRRGRPGLGSPLLFSLAGVLMLLAGAAGGALGAVDALDLQFLDPSETTWGSGVVHYVLAGAAIVLVGALHYWAPLLWGRPLREGAARLSAVVLLLGTILLSLPDLVSGALDQVKFLPGSVEDGVEALNAVSLVGGVVIVLGLLVFVVNLVGSLARRTDEADAAELDPWDGHTLEWAARDARPVPVRSATPLLDGQTEEAS
jgi:heme/copper-type cytochrome/quinol oxidase subunit 1